MQSDSFPLPVTRPGSLGEPDAERTVLAPAGSPAALPSGTRVGDYDLVAVIGKGGFGIVYLAWDPLLECRFAIKEYMPSAIAGRGADLRVSLKSEADRELFELGLRSFVNEAQMLARFDHPALVRVQRFWQANGTAYMLMQYYEGPTLQELIASRREIMDEAWLRGLLGPLTQALSVLHAAQCCHRDIAPDNVKLRADTGAPVLLDFGAARRVIEGAKRELTAIYKPGYAPLEQREESGMAQGPWTDVYALAAVLHRIVAGELPVSPVARLNADCYVPLAVRFASRYSPRFLAAIDHALAVRPADRTPSIARFRAELGLDRTNDATTSDSRPAGPSKREARVSRRGLVLALAGASLGVVAIGAWQRRAPAAPHAEPHAAPTPAVAVAAVMVPPAPASTPAFAPPRPALPQDAFDRVVAATTPGFVVEARVRKASLRVDRDALDVSLTSSRDGYVYVLLRDGDGLLLVFPNQQAPALKIRRGVPLVLPHLVARAPTGPERFLAIVSRWPRDVVLDGREEGIFRRLPDAGDGDIGRMACGAGAACVDEFGAVRFDLQVVD